MADIQRRPFSPNYSGLINQSVVASIIAVICFGGHEIMKRKRRGKGPFRAGLGSVESWEFGYLYQGRSWAQNPSPPTPRGWPLSWVKQVLQFDEGRLNELRGVDAAFYVRFMRGCFWWIVAQCLTTFPILFPIHVALSPTGVDGYEPKSMNRANITALVDAHRENLFGIHLVVLFWVSGSWMYTLLWICRGAFRYREFHISRAAERSVPEEAIEKDSRYYPHPHPQYPFQALPPLDREDWNRGLRLRTVMVSNLPAQLRSEKELKEYFQYYLSRPCEVPSLGLTSTTQPGFINKLAAYILNHAKRKGRRIPPLLLARLQNARNSDLADELGAVTKQEESDQAKIPHVEKVVIVRKMAELASLLERREDVLVRLETAHIKLARKALEATRDAMHERGKLMTERLSSRISLSAFRGKAPKIHIQGPSHQRDDSDVVEDRTDLLIRTLGPFVEEFGLNDEQESQKNRLLPSFTSWRRAHKIGEDAEAGIPGIPLQPELGKTIWDALFSLPRSVLDEFQPLIHLNALFRGKTVPSIDYFTTKLQLLNSLILENRARALDHFEPVSTAFVTFKDPEDARRACKFLAVHPKSPLVCLTTMAPSYEDLDWTRVMKSSYRVEFLKDWVVNVGVWAFTLFWLFPVSSLVAFVSIKNIQSFWPALRSWLDSHHWPEEILESFVPTICIAGLAILVPLILLLIAKKAHTILTLSELHDRIMTRYYKFLILNVLVFFCVGTTALQSFLNFKKIKDTYNTDSLLKTVAKTFPTAGPFYVGWLIFTTGMHSGFEIILLGLPLLVYPTTRKQSTPRKRNVGIRPRTFNYYYWLPNHLLVLHVLFVFSIMNPLVIPFGMIYFTIERTVIKNQLLHVYAKNYEGNGKLLMIRLIRYSFDGLLLSQVSFTAYMAISKKVAYLALSAVLIAITAVTKILATRLCRAKFEEHDLAEAKALCGDGISPPQSRPQTPPMEPPELTAEEGTRLHPSFWTWRFPARMAFLSNSVPGHYGGNARHPIPFGSSSASMKRFTRLRSMELPRDGIDIQPAVVASKSAPILLSELGLPRPSQVTQISGLPPPSLHLTEHDGSEEKPPSPRQLVTLHAKHSSWNDFSNPDHPYENPYYVRDVTNLLWLPRNPCGILNLDDTVDLHKSLTSEAGVGQLGAWGELTHAESMAQASMMSSMDWISEIGESDDEAESPTPLVESPNEINNFELTGEEEIDVSPTIAARARVETDVEQTVSLDRKRSGFLRHKQSTLSRRRASTEHSQPASSLSPPRFPISPRHPTAASHPSAPNATGHRSFSGASTGRASARRASSHFSDRRQSITASIDQELGLRRPTYATQASFTRSALSIVNSASSRITGRVVSAGQATVRLVTHDDRSGTVHVSAHEAVVHEVIAEETAAAEVRQKEEEEAEMKATRKLPWWKAWLFQSGDPPPPSDALVT